MTDELLTGAAVVTPGGVSEAGAVLVEGGRIAAVFERDEPRPRGVRGRDLGDGWLVPGFVDLHVHGGGGGSFASADPDSHVTAAEFAPGTVRRVPWSQDAGPTWLSWTRGLRMRGDNCGRSLGVAIVTRRPERRHRRGSIIMPCNRRRLTDNWRLSRLGDDGD